jgi:glycosyltransferase involved in cell wall biosynthesis
VNAGGARPTVSVVMPVYNAQAYLAESVTSVLDQTRSDFELILIDDGSTDGSPRLLEGFAARDPRVTLLRHAENLGQIRARNDGLAIAVGRYVATMDADDVCHRERLAQQVEFLESRPDLFLVGADAIEIDARGRTLGRRRCPPDPDRLAELLPRRNALIHASVMFRNDGRCRYREKMRLAEDYDFYLRLLSQGARLASLPRPLLRYRMHADSLSLAHAVHQMLLAEKAREFHRQRTDLGHDAYDAFDPATILSQDPATTTDERLLRLQITTAFSVQALPETRRLLRRYFRHHGVRRRPALLLYLAATYLPPSLLIPVKRGLKSVIRRG